MNLRRAVLAAAVILPAALIGVLLEVRGVELRYRLVEVRRRTQEALLEERALRGAVQAARAPGGLERRARELGVTVDNAEARRPRPSR